MTREEGVLGIYDVKEKLLRKSEDVSIRYQHASEEYVGQLWCKEKLWKKGEDDSMGYQHVMRL